jgi:hypothetical protein
MSQLHVASKVLHSLKIVEWVVAHLERRETCLNRASILQVESSRSLSHSNVAVFSASGLCLVGMANVIQYIFYNSKSKSDAQSTGNYILPIY